MRALLSKRLGWCAVAAFTVLALVVMAAPKADALNLGELLNTAEKAVKVG